jgi:predicted enzyme related to lactoylglutathione lyase
MSKVVHFEINSDKPEEDGIGGGIQKRVEPGGTFIVINVPSVDEYVKKIEANGGKVTQPKMPIPGIGWAAYFKDLDGNLVGIYQGDKDAK